MRNELGKITLAAALVVAAAGCSYVRAPVEALKSAQFRPDMSGHLLAEPAATDGATGRLLVFSAAEDVGRAYETGFDLVVTEGEALRRKVAGLDVGGRYAAMGERRAGLLSGCGMRERLVQVLVAREIHLRRSTDESRAVLGQAMQLLESTIPGWPHCLHLELLDSAPGLEDMSRPQGQEDNDGPSGFAPAVIRSARAE